VSKSRVTPNLRSYSAATASRSLGMPLLVEYRWLRGFCTASISLSTAISGEGRSGLPKARSTTSSPARRSDIFSASICANAYGGRAPIRLNSTKEKDSREPVSYPQHYDSQSTQGMAAETIRRVPLGLLATAQAHHRTRACSLDAAHERGTTLNGASGVEH